MPQPQPLEDSAASADPLLGRTDSTRSIQREYKDDKEDDSFLNEVEDSLLGHSSTKTSSGTILKDGNNDGEGTFSTGSETLYSTSLANSPSATATLSNPLFRDDKYSHSQYGSHQHNHHHPHQDGTTPLDDPSSLRRKTRAAVFYLLCSALHEVVIYKIAQRTAWSNITLFIPIELLISTIVAVLVTRYVKKSSNLRLQHLIGLNGFSILPSKAWKESAPLAGITVAAAVFRILKDAYLEASISTAVSVSRCDRQRCWQESR